MALSARLAAISRASPPDGASAASETGVHRRNIHSLTKKTSADAVSKSGGRAAGGWTW